MTENQMKSSISRVRGSGLQITPANEDVTPPSAIALDRAITNVGSRELERLSRGLSDQEVAQHIEAALKTLKGINYGIRTYDEWTSLWYLLWYQASQCNVAAGMLRNVFWPGIQYRPRRNGLRNLCLIDVGCGALNGQLGLSHLIKWERECLRDFRAVTFVGVDISGSMLRLGTLLWDELISNLSDYPNSPPVYPPNCKFKAEHFPSVDIRAITSLNNGETEYWVSEFNSLQSDAVKKQNDRVIKAFEPTVDVFTASGYEKSKLRSLISLNVSDYDFHERLGDAMTTVELKGELPQLAKFRRSIALKYERFFVNKPMSLGMLRTAPCWLPEDESGFICVVK